MPVTDETRYSDAMKELNEIVEDMKTSEDVDVDDLVVNVGRAKELLDFCGQKIQRASTQIQNVVTALQENKAPEQSEAIRDPRS